MNAGEWIALIALVLSGIGILLGAAWWMSMLYSEVCWIRKDTHHVSKKIDTFSGKVSGDLSEIKHDVNDLKIRVAVLEVESEGEA